MVLAVVGTMKAGKSTTINAIVGREILPNRNRPMTALPTLIEHAPGQKTPILHFEKRQPILDLIEKLGKKARKLKPESSQERLDGDSHLKDALQKLHQTRSIAEAYQGEEAIFDFLAWLNDLVRLSAALKVPFPFEAYAGVADFPRIEVEFFHLHNQNQAGQGKFMILDTPGFNEAGQQEHLLPMMREQLEKASAVLAVLDYTQLKSESEKNLRDELEQIAKHARDRMFALVNKFDNHDSNSDNAEQTREYVAKQLLPQLNPENIFPVSSRNAYLAQRAQLALTEGGIQWQEGQPASWVDDFGNEALGKRWKRNINDAEETRQAANELWNESRFDKPLEKVIQYGHQTAALLAVAAAAGVLAHNAQELTRFINGRLQAQDADPEKLRELIENAKTQISHLNKEQRNIASKLEKTFDSAQSVIRESMDAANSSAQKCIADLLERGCINIKAYFGDQIKQTAKEQEWFSNYDVDNMEETIKSWIDSLPGNFAECAMMMNKLKETKSYSNYEAMNSFFLGGEKSLLFRDLPFLPKDLSFFPDNLMPVEDRASRTHDDWKKRSEQPKIEEGAIFESEEKIDETLDAVSKEIHEMLASIEKHIGEKTIEVVKELDAQMCKITEEIEGSIQSFSEQARSAQLDALIFDAPRSAAPEITGSLPKIEHGAFVKEKTKERTVYKEQAGIWGMLKRKIDFTGYHWGYDESKETDTFFQLDADKIKDHCKEMISGAMKYLDEQVRNNFETPLKQGYNDFFEKVQSCFFQVQRSLQDGLDDQTRQEQSLRQIRAELQNLQQQHTSGPEDADRLNQWATVQLEKHAAALARNQKRK